MVLGAFFTDAVLPFVLVFVVVFAILQKSEVLGKGKTQMDALVSLVIGLILITVPVARDIVVGLMPWIGVGISVILMFFILYGFVAGKLTDKDGQTPPWMRVTFGILIGIFTLIVVLYVTGLNDLLFGAVSGAGDNLVSQIVFIAIIIGVFVIAVTTGSSGNEEKSKE